MKYDDRQGCYVIVGESATQGPIVMETEGEHTSYDVAMKRMREGPFRLRACVVRLTYVAGNELVLLDLKRLQKPTEKDDFA